MQVDASRSQYRFHWYECACKTALIWLICDMRLHAILFGYPSQVCCISFVQVAFPFNVYSTPKATRQGMSSTPAPPASPVLSVDGATPRHIPVVYESDGPKVMTKYNAPEDQPLPALPADSVKV